MRKPRDFDAELKALEDKAKDLKNRKVQQLGELVILTGADALTAHGFAAHTEARDGRLAIVSECCPFGATAQQYPHVVCALDRGMIRGMLSGLYGETSPQFETSRPDGGDHCVARV